MTPRRGQELPQLELDCMIVLWRATANQESAAPTAQEIRQSLTQMGRPLAPTTVLTVLQRLRQKGMITARRQGRAFRFSPRVSREQMRASAVARLIRNYFDGPDDLRRFLDTPAARSTPESAPSPAGFDASLL